jgi:hypothetical protein
LIDFRYCNTDYWNTIDLDRIEPFTIVLFQDQELFQLRWNGADKEAIKLDANEKHIWSSSTSQKSEKNGLIYFRHF